MRLVLEVNYCQVGHAGLVVRILDFVSNLISGVFKWNTELLIDCIFNER